MKRISVSFSGTSSRRASSDFLDEVGSIGRASCLLEASSDSDEAQEDSSSFLLSSRQRLALTLRNWSADASNAATMQSGGAVENLLELLLSASSCDDSVSLGHCVEAIFNLSRQPSLWAELLEHGAVKVICEVSACPRKCFRKSVLQKLAESLLHLTLHPGGELGMITGGAEDAVRNLAQQHRRRTSTRACREDPKLFNGICVKILFNLMCSDASSEAATRGLLRLRSRLSTHVSIMVPAIYNCSNSPPLWSLLVEDGALQALSSALLILSEDVDSGTFDAAFPESVSVAHQGAAALYNIASSGSCRTDMVLQNTTMVLKHLSSLSRFKETMFVIVGAMCKLCFCQDASLQKVVLGNGTMVDILRRILENPEDDSHERIARRCAYAL